MNDISSIRIFFDRLSDDFNSIYTDKKSRRMAYSKIIDCFFRKSIYLRFKGTLKFIKNPKNKRILDVGCGGGIYCIALAKKGAKVTGIDVSQKMLKLAEKQAKENNVEKRCRFIKKDIFQYSSPVKYNAIIAMGLFDYIKNPVDLVKKLFRLAKGPVIMSFPVKYNWLAPQRKIRYFLKKCPLYFYSKSHILRILRKCNIKKYKLVRIGRDYFVVASQNRNL